MFYKNLFIIATNFTCILLCILYHVIALHADFYVLCQKWRIKDVQSINQSVKGHMWEELEIAYISVQIYSVCDRFILLGFHVNLHIFEI